MYILENAQILNVNVYTCVIPAPSVHTENISITLTQCWLFFTLEYGSFVILPRRLLNSRTP